MESNNVVSYEYLRSLDDEARRLIDEVLVPKFEELSKSYPEAQNWNVSIGIYNDSIRHYYDLISFAMVDPALGADNPGASTLHASPLGNIMNEIMPTVSQILKKEEKKYGITVDDEPIVSECLNMYCYTKFNKR